MHNPTADNDRSASGRSMKLAERASEYDLIRAVKLGDQESFNVLQVKYRNRVYSHCRRFVNDEVECADLTQEVFLKAFKNMESYIHAYSFYTWLYRITANTCIDQIRKESRRTSAVSLTREHNDKPWAGETEQEISDDTFCPDERLMSLELGAEITKAMDIITPRQRSFLILKNVEGFTYNEIASKFDCSPGVVKSSLFQARNTLKDLLLAYKEI